MGDDWAVRWLDGTAATALVGHSRLQLLEEVLDHDESLGIRTQPVTLYAAAHQEPLIIHGNVELIVSTLP